MPYSGNIGTDSITYQQVKWFVLFLKQVAQLMKMLKTIHEHKRRQERTVMRDRAARHQQQQARIEASRAVKRKERAKHAFYRLGQLEKSQNKDDL